MGQKSMTGRRQKGIAMKFRWSMLLLVVGTLVLPVAVTGCEEEAKWAYRPMISQESRIYGDTGHTRESLSEDWVLLGEVEESISQVEPMVKGQEFYISNTLPAETELYGTPEDESILWARYNEVFIRYELIEE